MTFGLVVALAFAGTLTGSPLVITWLRQRGVIDIPNARSSHDVPTPRGVGIALSLSVAGAGMIGTLILPRSFGGTRTSVELAIVVLIATTYGLLGFVEDVRGVTPKWRLLLQTLIACTTVGAIFGVPRSTIAMIGVIAGCFGVIAYVNAVNFMDGINGISATHGIVVGSVWAAIGFRHSHLGFASAGVLIAAGSAGFLPWNFPRARGFLGDVGSYFLGGWLAASAAVGIHSGISAVAVLAPLTLYFVDTGVTICQRLRRRESLFTAHRGHVYQRVVLLGWSHTRATMLVTSMTTAISAASLLPTQLALSGAAFLCALYLGAPVFIGLRADNTSAVGLGVGAGAPTIDQVLDANVGLGAEVRSGRDIAA